MPSDRVRRASTSRPAPQKTEPRSSKRPGIDSKRARDKFSAQAPPSLPAPPPPAVRGARADPALAAEITAKRGASAARSSSAPLAVRLGRGDGGPAQVGTYNLAAGNDEHGPRILETAAHVAHEANRSTGALDLVAFQEVRGRNNSDFSATVLGQIWVQRLGQRYEGARVSFVSLNNDGTPVTDAEGHPTYDPSHHARMQMVATAADGTTTRREISVEALDVEGNAFHGDGPAPMRVYSMDLGDGREWSLVFGASDARFSDSRAEGGPFDCNYGNAVLVGPGYSLARRRDGSLDPRGLGIIHVGNDPDGEQRSALSVSVKTPGGESLRMLSAHLTNGGGADDGEISPQERARTEQYERLFSAVERYGGHAILAGDFNSKPGERTEHHRFMRFWTRSTHYPDPADYGLRLTDSSRGGIDHILVGSDVSVRGPTQAVPGGGSDHELVEGVVETAAKGAAATFEAAMTPLRAGSSKPK